MSDIKAIFKNTISSLIIKASTPFFSAVLYFYIARGLGVARVGQYEASLALLYIMQAFVAFGFPYLITREIAQDRTKSGKYLTNATLISLGVSILMIAVMVATAYFIMPNPETKRATWILSISLLPYGLSMVFQSICNGFERLDYVAVSTLTANVVKVIAGIIVLVFTKSFELLMVVISCSHFIMAGLSFIFTYNLIKKTNNKIVKVSKEFCTYILKASPLFILILALGTFRMNINSLLLNGLMSETEVGLYGAANKIINLISLGITGYIMALQPIIFRLFTSSREKFERICVRTIRFSYIFVLPMISGMSILNTKIIDLLYGKEFVPSAMALSILSWLLLLVGMNQIFANVVVASKDQKINLTANIWGTISLVVLSAIFIHFFSIIGACIANVISYIVVLVYQYGFISRNIFKMHFFHLIWKPLIGSVVMGIVLVLLIKLNLFLLIGIALVIYLGLMILLKVFTVEDLKIFKKILHKEKKAE